MAKGIAINGQLRGKLGGTVYYRANGEQISRARNFKPNNPQTAPQMLQRLMLANASKASKGLKEIIDHSFEGVRYGVDSVRHFESKAQLALKALTPSGVGASKNITPCVPLDAIGFPVAEYLISSGTLASANGEWLRDEATGCPDAFTSGELQSQHALGELTVTEVCAALGVPTDAQLTFVFTNAQDSVGGAGSEVIFSDNYMSALIRINFKQDMLDEPAFTAGGKFNENVLVAEKSTNVDLLEVSLSNNRVSFHLDYDVSGAALIVSRYVDGLWRRSTEKLTIAALHGTEGQTYALVDQWGWNYYDEVLKTLTKGKSATEDRLLNKEPNSDIG